MTQSTNVMRVFRRVSHTVLKSKWLAIIGKSVASYLQVLRYVLSNSWRFWVSHRHSQELWASLQGSSSSFLAAERRNDWFYLLHIVQCSSLSPRLLYFLILTFSPSHLEVVVSWRCSPCAAVGFKTHLLLPKTTECTNQAIASCMTSIRVKQSRLSCSSAINALLAQWKVYLSLTPRFHLHLQLAPKQHSVR